jgi:hypothetical protein
VMRPPMLPLPADAEAAVRGALQAAGLLSPAAVA